jgi:ElaA protein
VIDWRFSAFEGLSAREIHDLYRLRAEVFVVEQECAFQDLDGADPACHHLLGTRSGELVAYCRIAPPGLKFAEPSIGRVITSEAVRGTGLGRILMQEALGRTAELWPGMPVRIGAQRHLESFYASLGFATDSEPYDEDGIPHIEMLRK